MRRFVSAALTVVLVGALWSGVVVAAPGSDLAAAFALRTFGRLPADAPGFSSTADRALRGMAFRATVPVTLPPLARIAVPAMPQLSLAYDRSFDLHDYDGRFAPTSPGPIASAAVTPSQFSLSAPALRLATYQAYVASAQTDAAPAFSSSLRDSSTAYSTSTRIGTLSLSGSSASADVAELSARDDRLQTSSSLKAAGGRVNFNVGSTYERLSTEAVPTFRYRPSVGNGLAKSSLGDVPGLSAAELAGGYNDVTARGIDAGVAVPLTRNLTLGMQYGTQRYTGAVNAQDFTPNFDTSKYSYVGNLTFALPRSSSAIVVSARQYRFQDNLIPANSTSQTRADVNFTVKF
ncbi:MAG: hypothetical protein M3R30_08830 [Candidatus Eremiobacteraeota bacterium]|nr:hypothetical protein [Candidatus Eremiobacteraeota bacterium]